MLASAQPRPALAAAARIVPSRILRRSATGSARVAETGSDGAVRIVAGGQRIERRRDGVQLATETFAEPVLAALRSARGWRFITAHDAFDAPDFLGALTIVRTAREGRFGLGAGRPVSITAGRADVPALPSPGFVLDAAFGDDQRGVLIVEPGNAFTTEDGGRTWRPVALANDAGIAVIANDEARWVIGGETALEIARDGAAHEISLERVPRLRDSNASADENARALAMQRDVASWLAHAATHGAFDGARIVGSNGNRDFEFDLATDALTEGAAHTMPCEPSAMFHLDRLYAQCASESRVQLLERTPSGAWIERIDANTHVTSGCIVDADGEHAACRGRCAGDTATADPSAVCQHDRETAARTVEAPEGELLGFDRDVPIVLADGNRLDTLVVARGTDPPRPLAGSVESADVRISRIRPLHLGADDRVRAAAQLGPTGLFGIVEGRLSGTFVFHPAPDAAGEVHLGPVGHAITQVPPTWLQTIDEGLHWSALESFAGISDAAAQMLVAAADEPGEHALSCGEAGCTLGANVARLGWGPPNVSRYSARGSSISSSEPIDSAPAWRCESVGATLRMPLLTSEPLAGESVFTDASDAGTLVIRERPATRAQHGIRVQAQWTLSSAAARTAPVRASFTLERYFSPGTASTRWSIVALRPRLAVVVRCGAGPAGIAPGCDVIALVPGTAVAHVLGTIPAGELRIARSADALAVLTALDDSIPAAVPLPGGEPASIERLAVSIHDAEAQISPVAIGRDRSTAAGPYVLGTEAGIVRQRPDGSVLIEPLNEPSRVLAPRVTVEICGADAQGEFVLPAAGALAIRDSGSRDLELTARYGLAGDTLCLRAIDGAIVQLGRAGWITAQPGIDGIVGTARLREGIAPVRCQFVARSPR